MQYEGWYDGIEDDEYHGGDGLSSSNLKTILISPAHYIESKKTHKDTPAMKFGRLAHAGVLEPDKFNKSAFAAKTDKEKADIDKVIAMRERIKAEAGQCLIGDYEQSGYYHSPKYGLLKIRPDILGGSYISDIKTCMDARYNPFNRDVKKQKYELSAAFYLMVANRIKAESEPELKTFYWIAVEKTAPFGVKVYEASEEMLDRGYEQVITALDAYDDARSYDDWKAYDAKPEMMYIN